MKQLQVANRNAWRRWLKQNHTREKDGIWLVFFKKASGRPSPEYEDAVEDALCFGWIDSIIKRIGKDKFCRKFTPRKNESNWSKSNKQRVARLIKEGRMTESGFAKIEAAKRSGNWGRDPRPAIPLGVPRELSEGLARNKRAKDFFEKLAPTYRRHFIGWIVTAKRPETRSKRVREAMGLLGRGKKLGLK